MATQDTLMRNMNRLVTLVYRRTGGRVGGSVRGTSVLLLTVNGRKTGEPRTVPVGYFEHGDSLLVVGSYNGSDHEPQWFRNLRAAGSARIQRGGTVSDVAVRIASPTERDDLWRDVVVKEGKSFEGYAAKTDRVIPIAILTPS